ncbi:metalloregulator ArsR/SmtB family transcription factor [Gramella sp. AN32]|uniref:ArsR/SmtB family transcription factor n=1 Tax=Christiangramia antarctica TaxID=2058158 RepID=A0ABW5X0F1_9FLAO|nr:metalloregulator ArsR/SmtB family transcription factor [Gramella sp. AN32]MCM4157981.1 transcriptional regulator [Gramella sp. AN32]
MKLEISCTRAQADHKQINRCKNVLNASAASFSKMSQILALAGNEVRLKILFLLDMEKELCPCDIADILEMSVPAISQHLRKIKDAGIIESRREGQTLYYSIVKNEKNILDNIFDSIEIIKKTA